MLAGRRSHRADGLRHREDPRRRRASSLAGTPLYLAPELFADAAPSVASDVYSIGVLLYHLLTGSYPVRAPDIHGLRLAHQRGDATPVREARPEVPLKLANVIDRATDVDPTRRPTTAEALAAELSAIARPRLRAGARALAAAAALLVLLAVTSEIYGRLAGKPGPLRAMLAGFGRGSPARRAANARSGRRPSWSFRSMTWATGPRATRSSTAWPTRSSATSRASTDSLCARATRRSRSAARRAIWRDRQATGRAVRRHRSALRSGTRCA